MSAADSIEEKIASEYDRLSNKLRDAADYVAANPLDVATRSLRAVSASSGLAPATFSRLARALGFETYEDMRELSRHAVGRRYVSFSERAGKLQAEAARGETTPFIERQAAACIANIESMARLVEPARLEQAVSALHRARNIQLYGGLGSTGLIEYLAYMGNYFASNWSIAGRMGASLATSITDMNSQDALIVITKPPFARRAILASQLAAARGAHVIVITDTHTCPALKHASTGFILPSESPQFFSSYAATMVLLETIVGMLVARAGAPAQARIQEVEARNHRLEEHWQV